MDTIKLTIDNRTVEVPRGTTILKAAEQMGISIPTLCHFELDGLALENRPGGCTWLRPASPNACRTWS